MSMSIDRHYRYSYRQECTPQRSVVKPLALKPQVMSPVHSRPHQSQLQTSASYGPPRRLSDQGEPQQVQQQQQLATSRPVAFNLDEGYYSQDCCHSNTSSSTTSQGSLCRDKPVLRPSLSVNEASQSQYAVPRNYTPDSSQSSQNVVVQAPLTSLPPRSSLTSSSPQLVRSVTQPNEKMMETTSNINVTSTSSPSSSEVFMTSGRSLSTSSAAVSSSTMASNIGNINNAGGSKIIMGGRKLYENGAASAHRITPASVNGLRRASLTDLAEILREKDVEIQQLRDTMAQNETAIMTVYEERRQNCEVELQEAQARFEHRLRVQEQQAFRSEQSLLMQIFKLQHERKALRQELSHLRRVIDDRNGGANGGGTTTQLDDSERQTPLDRDDAGGLRRQVDELHCEVGRKVGEISLLRLQLQEARDEAVRKNSEMLQARSHVRELRELSDTKQHEIDSLNALLKRANDDLIRSTSEVVELRRQMTNNGAANSVSNSTSADDRKAPATPLTQTLSPEEARQEVEKMKQLLEQRTREFENEKERWLEEKNKVVTYQKFLQLNYVQTYQRCRRLETEVQQLTLEVEARDQKTGSSGETRLPGRQAAIIAHLEESKC